jgi:hypothetical protein
MRTLRISPDQSCWRNQPQAMRQHATDMRHLRHGSGPRASKPSLPGTRAAEIAEKVGAPTPTDTSIRPLDRHAGASSPDRTMTPAAAHRATTPCPTKEPFSPTGVTCVKCLRHLRHARPQPPAARHRLPARPIERVDRAGHLPQQLCHANRRQLEQLMLFPDSTEKPQLVIRQQPLWNPF